MSTDDHRYALPKEGPASCTGCAWKSRPIGISSLTQHEEHRKAVAAAADQPTTEPSEAGLRIEHGWLVEETTGCTCAGGTEESSYLHEPGCGLTPLQRLDNLPGWPLAPADTEVQWGVRYGLYIESTYSEASARAKAKGHVHFDGGTPPVVIARTVTRTVTKTLWEEA